MTKAETMRIAVLDENKYLVGSRDMKKGSVLGTNEVEVDPGDLPLDGTYKWMDDEKCFMPLGHGHPLKSKQPPVPESYALYLTMQAVLQLAAKAEVDVPEEVANYLDWYETNLKRRDEERTLFLNKRALRDIALNRR